jgi:hypothetical protein
MVRRMDSTCMGRTMATGRERMAATRARHRRGLRKLSVEVHEDELRAIALKGYEGAATTDPRQQAEAVSFFIADYANPPQ